MATGCPALIIGPNPERQLCAMDHGVQAPPWVAFQDSLGIHNFPLVPGVWGPTGLGGHRTLGSIGSFCERRVSPPHSRCL